MRTLLPLLLACLIGCQNYTDPGSNPSGSPSPPTSADAPQMPQGVIMAEDATGIWNESQVRQYITEELKLSSVNLTSTGGGNYQATGQTSEGTQYDITIEQKPGGIRYQWTTAEGRQGSGAFGTFVEP